MTAGKLAVLALPAGRRYHDCMNSISSRQQSGTTWFVSRHPGAIEWAKRQGLNIDRWVEHLDPAEVEIGDTVIGTLPVNLAAEACKRGAYYLHLSLTVPAEWRGRELSADELLAASAELRTYRVEETAE
jgi:CRISPR-associated protein Csx16